MHLRIGSRTSKLAMLQTHALIDALAQYDTKVTCEIIPITTSGDVHKDKPLHEIGGKALFLKELEIALLEDRIDVAVHSLKDVPGILPAKFALIATMERTYPTDCLCSQYESIFALPVGAKVGTSSLRRKVQLSYLRPDLTVLPLRGNVDSRIAKVRQGVLDAAILSHAGIMRMGVEDRVASIQPGIMVPAVGQGAIAVEALSSRQDLRRIFALVNCQTTWEEVSMERTFSSSLQANCTTPIGAYVKKMNEREFQAYFMLSSPNCEKIFKYKRIINSTQQVKIIAQQMSCMIY